MEDTDRVVEVALRHVGKSADGRLRRGLDGGEGSDLS